MKFTTKLKKEIENSLKDLGYSLVGKAWCSSLPAYKCKVMIVLNDRFVHITKIYGFDLKDKNFEYSDWQSIFEYIN